MVRTVLQVWRAEGLEGVAERVLLRIRRKPRLKRGYVLTVQLRDVQPKSPLIDIDVRELTASDEDEIQAVADFHFYGHTQADIRHYLSQGQQCYFAAHESRIICCFWVLTGRFYDSALNRYIELAGDEEYFLGAYTLPEFRGKNVLPFLVAQAASGRIHGSTRSQAVAFIDVHNGASLASTRKMGFTVVGHIGYLELLGLRFHYLLGRQALPKTSPRFFVSIAGR